MTFYRVKAGPNTHQKQDRDLRTLKGVQQWFCRPSWPIVLLQLLNSCAAVRQVLPTKSAVVIQ